MAQVASPDYTQTSSDPSLEEDTGKRSFLDKIKDKTRDKTKKLRNKVKPGSNSGEESPGSNPGEGDVKGHGDSSTSSSSEDESDRAPPARNYVEGITQPQMERNFSEDKQSISTEPTEGSPAFPATNFPGSFGAIANEETLSKEDESGLSREFESLSTNERGASGDEAAPPAWTAESDHSEKTVTEKASDGLKAVKEKAEGAVGTVAAKGDSYQSYISPDSSPDSASTEGEDISGSKPASKSWTQWAAEKVQYGKDTIASKIPATPTATASEDKSFPIGDEASKETGEGIAEKVSGASDPPQQQSYVQKATTGIYAAKDSLLSSTKPGEEHKALSQKVTETVENLPATIKSSLGFGSKSPVESSPHSAETDVSKELADAPAELSTDAPPQSPGLVSRFTSLFGKKSAGSETEGSSVSEPGTTTPVSETKVE